MIKIRQDHPVRGYQIPTFGMRELHDGELIDETSKLGVALLAYFPGICVLEGSAPVVVEEVKVPEPVLLVEEPEVAATVEEVIEPVVPVEVVPEPKKKFGRK